MAYTDLSTFMAYQQRITYQYLNSLGANDKFFNDVLFAGAVSTALTRTKKGVVTPGYSFISDTGLGVDSSGTNILDLCTAGVSRVKIDADGILTLPKQSLVRAQCSADFGTPAALGTSTKVSWNLETLDVQSEFDNVTNFRFTAKSAGVYLSDIQLFFLISGGIGEVKLFKNGSLYGMRGDSDTVQINKTYTDLISLAAGDYLEVFLSSGSTGTCYGTAGSLSTYADNHWNILKVA